MNGPLIIAHCDIITSLSNQFPLILSLKKRFIKFIINYMSCQNNIVSIISQVTICNPMSNTGSTYRDTLDSDGKLYIKSNMNYGHLISDNVCTIIDVLLDLIKDRPYGHGGGLLVFIYESITFSKQPSSPETLSDPHLEELTIKADIGMRR